MFCTFYSKRWAGITAYDECWCGIEIGRWGLSTSCNYYALGDYRNTINKGGGSSQVSIYDSENMTAVEGIDFHCTRANMTF